MTMTYKGTTALITGASSGLGAEFATRFAARGANLVLVARRADRLEELARELRAEHGVSVTVLAMDLSRADVGRELAAALSTRGIAIDTLINNAGFGTRGAVRPGGSRCCFLRNRCKHLSLGGHHQGISSWHAVLRQRRAGERCQHCGLPTRPRHGSLWRHQGLRPKFHRGHCP